MGVSGLLFDTNLVMYGRGDGDTLDPRTRVIEKGLYHLQTYAKYPYGDYRTKHDYLLFDLVIPLHNNGNRWATQLRAEGAGAGRAPRWRIKGLSL